jgi:hypothetical protein
MSKLNKLAPPVFYWEGQIAESLPAKTLALRGNFWQGLGLGFDEHHSKNPTPRQIQGFLFWIAFSISLRIDLLFILPLMKKETAVADFPALRAISRYDIPARRSSRAIFFLCRYLVNFINVNFTMPIYCPVQI